MTIGSDQLDAWGKTLIECDNLFREVQLLVRINPEAYNVDSDALTITAIANPDAWDNANLIHPIAFARHWAWHLAAENKAIPPITNAWVPLIRYVSAHLQYLGRDDRGWFADELRQMRGLLGALVNENGLSQGEAEDRQKINARQAREELRERVQQIDMPLTREELHIIWPELTDKHWRRLRDRKIAAKESPGRGLYEPSWVADMAMSSDPDLILGGYVNEEYVDVYNLDGKYRVSFEALAEAESASTPDDEW